MSRTQKQLQYLGYQGTPGEFRDLLKGTLSQLYPSWTDEKLTHNPDHAKMYCQYIRQHVGLDLSDEFVLSTLIKIRKHGWGT
jgi:hypothetical protein